ncbi:MAG: sulfatase-like hydrolase/transferase, partial [Tepidisphaeraceae bacterium]
MSIARLACTLWMALGLILPALATAAGAVNGRPNVVFVLVDDLGYGELGCYGNTRAHTPNIDRLASEGVRFERFYVNSPICSPSRVAFMTGQYPARWRITSYMEGRAINARRSMADWLLTDAPSLARMLRGSGYRTGHFGKWHMGGGRDVGDAPLITEYGFDESLTQFEGMGDRIFPTFDTLLPKQPHRALPLGLASEKLGRGKTEFVKRSEVTGRYVGAALDFI